MEFEISNVDINKNELVLGIAHLRTVVLNHNATLLLLAEMIQLAIIQPERKLDIERLLWQWKQTLSIRNQYEKKLHSVLLEAKETTGQDSKQAEAMESLPLFDNAENF